MRKKIEILGLMLLLVFTPITISSVENMMIPIQGVVEPKADVIVTKYRNYHGPLQYRRWNETRGYWVDKEWITLK